MTGGRRRRERGLEKKRRRWMGDRIERRVTTISRRRVSGEGYITRRGGRGRERREIIVTYDNKASTKEAGDAKHWRRDQKEERKRGQKAICKTKRKVWLLGRLAQKGSPDPGRRTKLGVVWGAGGRV